MAKDFFQIGAKFGSFDEIKLKLDEYEKATYAKYYVRDSRKAESVIRKQCGELSDALLYYEVKFCCIKGGKPFKKKGRGLRETKTFKNECPAHIAFRATKDGKHLQVKSYSNAHNHETSKELFDQLSHNRALSAEEKCAAMELLLLQCDKKLLRDKLQTETGKSITMKDLNNLKRQYGQISPTKGSSLKEKWYSELISSKSHVSKASVTSGCDDPSVEFSSSSSSSSSSSFASIDTIPETVSTKPLEQFEKINVRVKSAALDDLGELHDLICIKPSEGEQIRENILKFTGFDFDSSSMEYHFRKTLLAHMSTRKIKKIASLLDLNVDDSQHVHKSVIADSILKFLMDPTDSRSKSAFGRLLSLSTSTVHLTNEINPLSLLSSVCSRTLSNLTNGEGDISLNSPSSVNTHLLTNGENSTHLDLKLVSLSCPDDVDSMMPLSAFINHPSDSQLERDITEVMHEKQFSVTMNELVNEVFAKYPQFDIRYRTDFIKSTARNILSNLPGV